MSNNFVIMTPEMLIDCVARAGQVWICSLYSYDCQILSNVCLTEKGHSTISLLRISESKYNNFYKAWVATIFWVARTYLARPDLGPHAHMCAPPI